MTKKSILIIALSARPFVKAAKQAGYNVTVIDAFADQDTKAFADKTFVVDYDNNGFVTNQLLAQINTLALDEFVGFVYGSGFDAQPVLLKQISALLPMIGNSPECVAAIKTATSFFAVLDALSINYPDTFLSKPADAETQTYLMKYAGGCGGTHIQDCNLRSLDVIPQNHYFQQYIDGRSVSLLFLASNNKVNIVGFNEQLDSKSHSTPFRYGGALSNIELSHNVKTQLTSYAEKLTMHFGLVGLNSLDVIVKNEVVHVLEINPRLSATFDLYADDTGELFKAHLQANQLENDEIHFSKITKQSNAHAIIYAPQAMQISNAFIWPSWATDISAYDKTLNNIMLDAPICTVLASAQTPESAKQLVQTRVKMLLESLTKHSLSHPYASKT